MSSPLSKKVKVALQDYGITISNLLGTGAFSNVYMGTVVDSTGSKKNVAVKHYVTDSCPLVNETQLIDIAKQEVDLLSRMKHPNVVGVLNFVNTEKLTFMTQELAVCDLFSRIANKQNFPAKSSAKLLDGILAGLHYLHKTAHLVHMDLKSENILVFQDDVARLADMDAALPIYSETFIARGTRDVHPPEFVRPSHEPRMVTESIDIWALGLLAFMMITGRYAWDIADHSDNKYVAFEAYWTNADKSKVEKFWLTLPPKMQSLFRKMLSINPENRASAQELQQIVAEDWEQGVNDIRHQKRSPAAMPKQPKHKQVKPSQEPKPTLNSKSKLAKRLSVSIQSLKNRFGVRNLHVNAPKSCLQNVSTR